MKKPFIDGSLIIKEIYIHRKIEEGSEKRLKEPEEFIQRKKLTKTRN